MVAPVVEEGARQRRVSLPGAGWWPLLGVEAMTESGATMVAAEATEIPVFVRPGTILTLLPEVVDSFYGAVDPEVTHLQSVAGKGRLVLYPAPDGSLGPQSIGGDQVEGVGWTANPPWPQATRDGVPLMPCLGAQGYACREEDGVRISGPSVLEVGSARMALPEGRWRVYVGGRGWRPWNEPTALTELNPDISPPCHEE